MAALFIYERVVIRTLVFLSNKSHLDYRGTAKKGFRILELTAARNTVVTISCSNSTAPGIFRRMHCKDI